jgi:4'-phosphopantetheinyl transferase
MRTPFKPLCDPPRPASIVGGMIEPTADEVHVWSIALDDVEPAPKQLTVTEWERFSALADDDRRQRAGTRASLRAILGAYLDRPPASVLLVEGERPRLTDGELEFSVTHSSALALVAVARAPVGVDIEQVEEIAADEFAELVEFVLAPAEVSELMTVPERERVAAYYRIWTRKEAYVKASGEGIAARPLPEVVVGVAEPALLAVEGMPAAEVARWTVADVAVQAGYAAALVVRHRQPRVSVRRWPP